MSIPTVDSQRDAAGILEFLDAQTAIIEKANDPMTSALKGLEQLQTSSEFRSELIPNSYLSTLSAKLDNCPISEVDLSRAKALSTTLNTIFDAEFTYLTAQPFSPRLGQLRQFFGGMIGDLMYWSKPRSTGYLIQVDDEKSVVETLAWTISQHLDTDIGMFANQQSVGLPSYVGTFETKFFSTLYFTGKRLDARGKPSALCLDIDTGQVNGHDSTLNIGYYLNHDMNRPAKMLVYYLSRMPGSAEKVIGTQVAAGEKVGVGRYSDILLTHPGYFGENMRQKGLRDTIPAMQKILKQLS